MHGGSSLIGAAAPRFKTGRYSKYLPERLIERYQEATADSELLALRDDISLLDARMGELLARVDTGESGQIWKDTQEAFLALRKAISAQDGDAITVSVRKLDALIRKGKEDYQAWSEIWPLIDRRRLLVESERRRLVEMRQMISAERAMVLLGAVLDTIKRNVTDRAILAAISADIGKLMAVEAGPATDRRGNPE